MASSSTLYPLSSVLNQLSIMLNTQKTGTFLLATEQNTSCRIALRNGTITHCSHHRHKGYDAVLSLLQVKYAACSFSENLMFPFRADTLVDHQLCVEILKLSPSVEHTNVQKPSATAQHSQEPTFSPNYALNKAASSKPSGLNLAAYSLGEKSTAL